MISFVLDNVDSLLPQSTNIDAAQLSFMGAECEQCRAQHTALWDSSVSFEDGRHVDFSYVL